MRRISPIAEAKKPKLSPSVTMESIEKKMRELQNALDTIIEKLVPYGFGFNYGGFIERNNCKGFAKEFLEKPNLAKFRKNIDLSLTKPTIVADDYPVT